MRGRSGGGSGLRVWMRLAGSGEGRSLTRGRLGALGRISLPGHEWWGARRRLPHWLRRWTRSRGLGRRLGLVRRLAGVIAAHTTLPVIGVPIPSTSLQGMDSLLATVQMPAGIPVATVAIGKPGATNAGILAAQIIGLGDAAVAKKLTGHKEKLARGVEGK